MANTRYPLGLEAVLSADVDFLVDTISLQMYSGAAVYSDTHEFLDEIAGSKAGSPVTVTAPDVTDGKFTGTVGPFTPPAVTVVAIVLYENTGVDSTSRLLGWMDQKGDGTPVAIAGDGTPFMLNWTAPLYTIGGS